MSFLTKILRLTKQLYPTGRAFAMPKNGYLDLMHQALAIDENKAFEDATSILYSILPDNANFTPDDATDWERRLGMTPSSASLNDRKAAIIRKMNYPGANPAKGHYLHLQYQLQLAGFNVYVYENIFLYYYPSGYVTRTALDVCGSTSIFNDNQHGDFQHGDVQHGGYYNNKIANSLDQSVDNKFDEGKILRKTFFIGGNPVGSFANVPAVREQEFRELILKLKPAQTVGYLFINYV